MYFNIHLHAESGAKDGEQHGRVAADDRTVFEYQHLRRMVVGVAEGEAYL